MQAGALVLSATGACTGHVPVMADYAPSKTAWRLNSLGHQRPRGAGKY